MWAPLHWWRKHINKTFFRASLSQLVQNGILRLGGEVFLPFNPHTYECLAFQDDLETLTGGWRFNFNAELATESQLDGHALWNTTHACDHTKFQATFKKDINHSTSYITWPKEEFLGNLTSAHPDVIDLAHKIDRDIGLRNVRFIKLTASTGCKGDIPYFN